ncbi:hypothetical protein [Mesorhizobium sp.]|uniref:hypothetical protein n=1 Tax=Mesorhizobium sp. TaxID=1871066 RepID=UPI000FE813BF|nr:hypothetical protein [Mesorhizobium sp.]RWG34001.1 MAG: hypothetical protein EOQ60_10295 [Mesorhizobium sp.]
MTPEQVSSDPVQPTRDLEAAALEAARKAADEQWKKWTGGRSGLDGMHFFVREAIRAYLAARSVPEAELKEALENVERYVAVAREEKERAQASEAEASDLRRKLEKARKALEPFEHYVDEWTDRFDDDTPIIDEDGEFVAKLGAFRAARAALATVEGRET